MEEGSTALRVSQPGDGAAPLVIPILKAPKNGYAFIYLNNPPQADKSKMMMPFTLPVPSSILF